MQLLYFFNRQVGNKEGTPIYTFYLAVALTDAEDEQYWNWKLRPEVSNAIAALGLHT